MGSEISAAAEVVRCLVGRSVVVVESGQGEARIGSVVLPAGADSVDVAVAAQEEKSVVVGRIGRPEARSIVADFVVDGLASVSCEA
jgi:hypothetical protein